MMMGGVIDPRAVASQYVLGLASILSSPISSRAGNARSCNGPEMNRDVERHKLFNRRSAMLLGSQAVLFSALVARMYYLQVLESNATRHWLRRTDQPASSAAAAKAEL